MNRTLFGSALLSCIVIGTVCGFVLLSTTDVQQIVASAGQRGWVTTASAQEGGVSLGSSNGGVLQVYIYKHQASPGIAYATNLSNVSAFCYAWANNLNVAMTGNVPYGLTFDIVYKVRVNVSEAFDTIGSVWMETWVRSNITCANLGITPDTPMVGVQISNNTDWMWMNFYINNVGSGYTITNGENVFIDAYELQCYMM